MKYITRGRGKDLLLLLTVVILALVIYKQAAAAAGSKQLVILLDRVSLGLIKENKLINELAGKGAFGLMNVRPDGPIQTTSTFFSLASGSRAPAINREGSVKRTGKVFPWGSKDIVLDGSKVLKEQLQKGSYLSKLSLLTTELHRRGRKVGLLSAGQPHDSVLWLAADDRGLVDWLSVIHPLQNMEFGESAGELWERCDLLFVYFNIGDITGYAQAELNREALNDYLEQKLRTLLEFVDLKKSMVWILAPTPPQDLIDRGYKLSWVLLYRGEGRTELSGEKNKPVKTTVLSSPTTRRKGLVTIADIAPTILNGFSIELPETMMGRVIRALPEKWPLSRFIDLNQGIVNTAQARPFFVKGFILIQIIILLMVIVFLLTRGIWATVWVIYQPLIRGLLLLQGIPLTFLFFPSCLLSSIWLELAFMIILIYLVYKGIRMILDYSKIEAGSEVYLMFIFTLTWLAITVDLFAGQFLLKRSLLGYCPIIGARYYGLGNEFMGIYLGAGITLLGLLADHEEKRLTFSLPGIPLLVICTGHPGLGANFGGLVTASSTGLIFLYQALQRKYGAQSQKIFVISVLAAGITFLIPGYRDFSSPYPTHLGLTLRKLAAVGPEYILEIMQRKFAMNLKLLRWTIWTRVLLAFLFTLLILLRKPIGILRQLQYRRPYFMAALKSLLLGSLITMLVNDSGVVAAATLLFHGIFTLIFFVLLSLQERLSPQNNP